MTRDKRPVRPAGRLYPGHHAIILISHVLSPYVLGPTMMLHEVNGDEDSDKRCEESQVVSRVLELGLRVTVRDDSACREEEEYEDDDDVQDDLGDSSTSWHFCL